MACGPAAAALPLRNHLSEMQLLGHPRNPGGGPRNLFQQAFGEALVLSSVPPLPEVLSPLVWFQPGPWHILYPR